MKRSVTGVPQTGRNNSDARQFKNKLWRMRMAHWPVYSHNSPMKIGAVLKIRRDDRGETLEEVAHRAGTDASNLSRIERGTQQPSVGLLEALARALETRVSELYLEVERT